MRLNYNKILDYFRANNPEPEWVAEIRTKREALAELGGSEAMAAAFRRIGMRGSDGPAPGEPVGGLAGAKPIHQVKTKKFDPKNRCLGKLPAKHVDDFDNFVDGKTNKTRLVGTWARFPTGSDGRTKFQLRRWCVCDVSKDTANKECATYPGHFVSTQGS